MSDTEYDLDTQLALAEKEKAAAAAAAAAKQGQPPGPTTADYLLGRGDAAEQGVTTNRTGLDYLTSGASSGFARLGGTIGTALMGGDTTAPATAPVTTPRVNVADYRDGRTVTRPTGSPEEDLKSGMTTNWAGQPTGNAGADLPSAPAPVPETAVPETDEQKLRKLWAQFGGGVGAPAVKMNEYLKQGYGQQREANQDMLPALKAEDETKALARQGIQAEGQNYVEGLKKLQDKQSALFDQRRGQMADNESRMAQAEKSFDPNRVLRNLSEKPIASGVLAFTAGLVGALKGAAGDMSPNEIVAEVDKSIERDVKKQQEDWVRMGQTMTTQGTDFETARKMGADDQTALATASLASMDQHKRALEFAEARITDASKKAALKGAIGTINVEQGKMQYQMDVHNQAASLSASKANRDFKMQLMQSIQQRGMMDPKLVEQATKEYQTMALNPRFEATRAKSSAVGEASGLLSEFSKKEVERAFNPSMVKSLRVVMDKAAAAAGGKGGGVVSGAVTQYLNDQSHASQDPKERKLLAALSKITNADMLKLYGSTVNMGDDTRYAATKTFDSAENFLSWFESVEKDALEDQRGLIITGKNNPALGSMLTDLFAPSAFQIDQRRKANAATAAANAAAGQGSTK